MEFFSKHQISTRKINLTLDNIEYFQFRENITIYFYFSIDSDFFIFLLNTDPNFWTKASRAKAILIQWIRRVMPFTDSVVEFSVFVYHRDLCRWETSSPTTSPKAMFKPLREIAVSWTPRSLSHTTLPKASRWNQLPRIRLQQSFLS